MTVRDEISFLSTSNFAVADRNDCERVCRCLVHTSVDVRIAAVKCRVFRPNAKAIAMLIETLAQHESWESGGVYPASKLIAPHVNESNWRELASAFPELAKRDVTGYQVLCQNCPATRLATVLESHLFAPESDASVCHLAIKSLSAMSRLNQPQLWRKCLTHRFSIVVQCARQYLESSG